MKTADLVRVGCLFSISIQSAVEKSEAVAEGISKPQRQAVQTAE